MRLPDEFEARLTAPVIRGLVALACAGVLGGCSTFGGDAASGGYASAAAMPANGPQADYPVLVGDAYSIGGVSFTPSDTLNYDDVGYLAGAIEGEGITGAHHTLPVPSYVEVTSLESGRTILVRIEQRGPMDSTDIMALTPAALAQLGASSKTPVRVRRVNPPEEQRAMLRAGGEAPLRMETPQSLVRVLKRQLPAAPAVMAAEQIFPLPEPAEEPEFADLTLEPDIVEPVAIAQAAPPAAAPAPGEPEVESFEHAFVEEEAAPTLAAAPVIEDGFVVQAAAFSNAQRADRAASSLGGMVTQAGSFYRVRTGPFATRSEAEASLAIVKAAGYSDARILTSG